MRQLLPWGSQAITSWWSGLERIMLWKKSTRQRGCGWEPAERQSDPVLALNNHSVDWWSYSLQLDREGGLFGRSIRATTSHVFQRRQARKVLIIAGLFFCLLTPCIIVTTGRNDHRRIFHTVDDIVVVQAHDGGSFTSTTLFTVCDQLIRPSAG